MGGLGRLLEAACYSIALPVLLAASHAGRRLGPIPQVLYSSAAWLAWLHALPTRHLAALYIKYLLDSFQ